MKCRIFVSAIKIRHLEKYTIGKAFDVIVLTGTQTYVKQHTEQYTNSSPIDEIKCLFHRHRVRCQRSTSETNSSVVSSYYMTANSGESSSEISPFDENIEPLASAEEIAEYEATVAEEQQVENMLQDRFDAHVDVNSW